MGLVARGRIGRARIDEACRRVLELKGRNAGYAGEFHEERAAVARLALGPNAAAGLRASSSTMDNPSPVETRRRWVALSRLNLPKRRALSWAVSPSPWSRIAPAPSVPAPGADGDNGTDMGNISRRC